MCQSWVSGLIFCLPDPVPQSKGVSQEGLPYWLGSHWDNFKKRSYFPEKSRWRRARKPLDAPSRPMSSEP